MLLAALLATVTAACPPNVANGLKAQPTGSQLITVEAAKARATSATLRIWRRSGGCWTAAGRTRRGSDGTGLVEPARGRRDRTPTGTFRINATMYGNEPNPGVAFRYRRLRCGDWWDEDPTSPTYNTFQRVACGSRPPFRIVTEGMWQNPKAYPYLAVVEFNMRPTVPGRGSGIFLRADRARDERLRQRRRADLRVVLSSAERRARDRDRDGGAAARLSSSSFATVRQLRTVAGTPSSRSSTAPVSVALW